MSHSDHVHVHQPLRPARRPTSPPRAARWSYKRRRFLPNPAALQVLAEVVVAQGDRLDLITARTLGDPEHFWRVCDANNATNPFDLTSEIGRRLRIPLPQFENQ